MPRGVLLSMRSLQNRVHDRSGATSPCTSRHRIPPSCLLEMASLCPSPVIPSVPPHVIPKVVRARRFLLAVASDDPLPPSSSHMASYWQKTTLTANSLFANNDRVMSSAIDNRFITMSVMPNLVLHNPKFDNAGKRSSCGPSDRHDS